MVDGCGGRWPSKYPLSGKSYVIKGKRYYILASAKGYKEKGIASWYGRDFHGLKTSSGERYNMYEITAAHKTLPLHTWVRVTNTSNGRELIVRINDRGPFVVGRIIDMSMAGARELGFAEAGTTPVLVEALGTAEEREVNGRMTSVLVQPPSYTEGHFTVQVGAFQDQAKARSLADRLGRQFGMATIQVYDRGDRVFHRVHVADLKTIAQAEELQSKLEQQGFTDCFVVAR